MFGDRWTYAHKHTLSQFSNLKLKISLALISECRPVAEFPAIWLARSLKFPSTWVSKWAKAIEFFSIWSARAAEFTPTLFLYMYTVYLNSKFKLCYVSKNVEKFFKFKEPEGSLKNLGPEKSSLSSLWV